MFKEKLQTIRHQLTCPAVASRPKFLNLTLRTQEHSDVRAGMCVQNLRTTPLASVS